MENKPSIFQVEKIYALFLDNENTLHVQWKDRVKAEIVFSKIYLGVCEHGK
jgi:hypothetical protein